MSKDYLATIAATACPRCGAPTGQLCVRRDGQPLTSYIHLDRAIAYAAQQESPHAGR